MPFALVFVGTMLIVTGFQDTYKQFGSLVAGDFTGNPNFFSWFVSIAVIGGIGYYKPLEGFSRAFMGLIIAVLILRKGTGLFSQLNSQISNASSTNDSTIGAPLQGSTSANNSGGSGSSLSSVTGIVSTAATVASLV